MNSTLALRLTCSHNAETFEIPPVYMRSKLISENPVAAVQVFYRMMRNFFSIIVGLPLDHFTGRRANVDRLLQRNENKYIGAYGRPNAAYGIMEDQKNKSLHTRTGFRKLGYACYPTAYPQARIR